MIERWDASQVCGRGVDGNGSKLECIANGVISQEGENIGREIQHHQVGGIFLANQAAGEQSEAGLHEQNEIARVQSPGEIRRHAHMPDTVGQLNREWFLRYLCLIVVICLLIRGVIGSCLIGRLRNHKRIARSVDRGGFISGGNARRIGLGFIGKAGRQ